MESNQQNTLALRMNMRNTNYWIDLEPVTKEPKVLDKLDGERADELIHFRYSITSYGADYPVDGLVKRIQAGDIFIPEFQRLFVWDLRRASRFVESLLLGLPVPGIFLSREQETQKLLVIDGQQRLRTLQYFYEGIFVNKKEFALVEVQSQFEGLTYRTLKDEDKRRLNDSILHATIVRQDVPSKDNSSIYYIFERLNTGGKLLHPQEIRTAIYHGRFNEVLNKLNQNPSWREIYGAISRRMRDRELILRFLALYFTKDVRKEYKAPMKEFLNGYMSENRNLELQSEDVLQRTFSSSIEVIHKCLGSNAFKPFAVLNAAVFDAVMIGVARRLEKGDIDDLKEFRESYDRLISSDEFRAATESRTAVEENVRNRIELATKAFADLR